jgi:hypothetical protein
MNRFIQWYSGISDMAIWSVSEYIYVDFSILPILLYRELQVHVFVNPPGPNPELLALLMMMMINIIIMKWAINIVIASVKMMNKNKREKTLFVCTRTYDASRGVPKSEKWRGSLPNPLPPLGIPVFRPIDKLHWHLCVPMWKHWAHHRYGNVNVGRDSTRIKSYQVSKQATRSELYSFFLRIVIYFYKRKENWLKSNEV